MRSEMYEERRGPHCLSRTWSPISPLTLSEQLGNGLSMLEEDLHSTPALDPEGESSVIAPIFEGTAGSVATAFTSAACPETLIATSTLCQSIAKLEWSSEVSNCQALYPDSSSERPDMTLDVDIKAPTKRVKELVAENQSCNYDSTAHPSILAGRSGRKRLHREYSRDAQESDTQEVGAAKRQRFSKPVDMKSRSIC